VVVANNKIFVAGGTNPGSLYEIDPSQSPGVVATVASTLGNHPTGIAFDGSFLWTANFANGVSGGSVSGIDTQSPFAVFTATTGFTAPTGILYDGTNVWVTDSGAGMLFKLDLGSIVQSVPTGVGPGSPVFDGANIWVPNGNDNSITVVQASTGSVVATIASDASNRLNSPTAASFDGERILVTNLGNNTVTVFKAADLSFIANVSTGAGSNPIGACSDGINFWVTLITGAGNLLRF
jgi:YVTN family beta-propeller protein